MSHFITMSLNFICYMNVVSLCHLQCSAIVFSFRLCVCIIARFSLLKIVTRCAALSVVCWTAAPCHVGLCRIFHCYLLVRNNEQSKANVSDCVPQYILLLRGLLLCHIYHLATTILQKVLQLYTVGMCAADCTGMTR